MASKQTETIAHGERMEDAKKEVASISRQIATELSGPERSTGHGTAMSQAMATLSGDAKPWEPFSGEPFPGNLFRGTLFPGNLVDGSQAKAD